MTTIAGTAAVVTGAGAGIGRAMAQALAGEGAKVVVADRDEAAGNDTVAALRDSGAEALFVQCDVADPAAIAATLKAAVKQFGRLDILCNNAGVSQQKPLFEDSEGAWRRVMEIDLMSVIEGTRLAVALMTDGGVIINTGSMAALLPSPGSPIYATAKAGVVHFTRSLAYLAEERGIRVNAICPTYTKTAMGLEIGEDEVRRRIGGILEPEDVATGVLEMIRDDTCAGAVMRVTIERGRDFAFAAAGGAARRYQ